MSRAGEFLELHRTEKPLLMPNPWDAGSAKLLASAGFKALATTSAGFAATIGRNDGRVTREEALEHAAEIVAAVDVPVSGDLENGFGHDPEDAVATVRGAIEAGLAGCSIEDFTGDESDPFYDFDHAVARVAAAVEAARSAPDGFVLTARAENFVHDNPDLADTIKRLQAFEEAGADVLFAPGISTAEEIRAVVGAVERPVNVVARPGMPSVEELGRIGVARLSTGGAFAFAALGALTEAVAELKTGSLVKTWQLKEAGAAAAGRAFD